MIGEVASEPVSDGDGAITPQERVLLGNILKLHDRTAGVS